MTTKQKILAALDCALDDLSEERLVDILLDAYERKKARIVELEAENAAERQRIHAERKALQREQHRLSSDPLYGARGEYFFTLDGRYFSVSISGRDIYLTERRIGYLWSYLQISHEDWRRSNKS